MNLFLMSLHDKALTNCNYCMSNVKIHNVQKYQKEYIYSSCTSFLYHIKIEKNKRKAMTAWH